MGEVIRWAGTISCVEEIKQQPINRTASRHPRRRTADKLLNTHVALLGLLDEKGLSVVAELHVQLDGFPVDLDVNLKRHTVTFCEEYSERCCVIRLR